MADPVTVPRLGWSMEEGTFVEWLKRDGDRIQPGDPLFVLESEKAAENIEAIDAGILRIGSNGPQPGEKVLVGQILAYLVADGESAPELPSPITAAVDAVASSGAPSATPEPVRALSQPRRRPTVSPRARRVAEELGIEISHIRGSGRTGRVRERDVRAAGQRTGNGRLIPHTPARKLIAARMVAGVTQAAPVTLTTKADATNLVNLRGQFKAAGQPPESMPSYNDIILKLIASTLRQHPTLQAQWREEGLSVPECIHIGLAVDSDAGLLVPVIRDAETKTLRQIAAESRTLIAQAREGRITGDQMRDATFTITNLGMFSVDAFTPIINLPQSAILGIGRIVREAVPVGDGFAAREMLTLSLTFDHRVIDGAPAARFLDSVRKCVEQPAVWLVA